MAADKRETATAGGKVKIGQPPSAKSLRVGTWVIHENCDCGWNGLLARVKRPDLKGVRRDCVGVDTPDGAMYGEIFLYRTRVVTEEEAALWMLTHPSPRNPKDPHP